MRKKATRREFMTTAGIGAAAMLDTSTVRSSAFLYGSTVGDLPMGSLSAWVTDNERRLTSVPPIVWKNPRDAVAQDAIIVRPDVKLQSMLGFGAALTDGSCYLFDNANCALLSPGLSFRNLDIGGAIHLILEPLSQNTNEY
jgi:hypothetical protein